MKFVVEAEFLPGDGRLNGNDRSGLSWTHVEYGRTSIQFSLTPQEI